MNFMKTLIATSLFAHVQARLAESELSIKEAPIDDAPGGPGGPGGPGPVSFSCAGGQFAGPGYQSNSASDKLSLLWAEVNANTTVKPHDWVATRSLFTRDMNVTYDELGDELPYQRVKVNHSQGVVGIVKWEDLGNHDYTGIYHGNSKGLMRLSEGNFLLPEVDGLTPTAAFKFTRDGMPSVNHVANTAWGPSGSYDFFANWFKTHIGDFDNSCEKQTIERKFEEVHAQIGSVGLSEFSRRNVDGSHVGQNWFPADLMFIPHSDVTGVFPDAGQWTKFTKAMTPFYDQLMTLSAGTTLFEVWAREQPEECGPTNGDILHELLEADDDSSIRDRKLQVVPPGLTDWQHIANIHMATSLTTSHFGDQCLFFKHERLDKDFEDRPELEEHANCGYGSGSTNPWGTTPINPFPNDQPTAKAWVRGQLHDHECPFAWLLNWPFTPIF